MTDLMIAPAFADPGWAPDIYTAALKLLPEAETPEDQATHLDTMAGIAGAAASQTYGTGAEDSDEDALAWHETATLLRQLAAARRGLVLTVESWWDQADEQEWEDLANAVTAAEFAAAFSAVSTEIADQRTEEDKPAIREPAVRRLCAAAAACIAGMQAQGSR